MLDTTDLAATTPPWATAGNNNGDEYCSGTLRYSSMQGTDQVYTCESCGAHIVQNLTTTNTLAIPHRKGQRP